MMEQESEAVDRNKVLDVKPLRSLAPVFPASSNGTNQGAHPMGIFPPGVAPFYPYSGATDSQTPDSVPHRTPVSNAVPINSYRTPPTAGSGQTYYSGDSNGDAGSSKGTRRRRSHAQYAEEDDDDSDVHVIDAEPISRMDGRRIRSRVKAKNAGPDSDLIIDNILSSLDISAINESSKMDGDRDTVMFVLTVFELIRKKITQIDDNKEGSAGGRRRPDLRSGALLMSQGIRTNMKKRIGAIPSIEVGDIFFFRMEMCVAGLHSPSMAGIDYLASKLGQEEEPLAVSIVSSGGYEDNVEDGDVLIYSGQGGNVDIYNKNKEQKDQKLERGNLALEKSAQRGNEIRVIRGLKDPFSATGKVYIYDGLYRIQESWMEKGKKSVNVFKNKFVRIPGQPPAFTVWQSVKMWKDGLATRTGTILPDLTSGTESIPVSLVNDIDGEKGPAYFTYIRSLKYPRMADQNETPVFCTCTGGCLSGNLNCACIQKNEGYLPYNVNGIIVSKKSMVYECGPSCQCPPNCRNRSTESGLKLRLEVFRTKDKGWGLRSWDAIRAGMYICEYAGESIDISDKNDLGCFSEDDYIFDATRTYPPLEFLPGEFNEDPQIPFPLFISAKDAGNVARFMNHSCSPTVFWQPVLRGNNSDCDIHVAFHAIRHIPPLTELTYDYGIVQSGIAEQWKKNCLCGSVKCKGYFY